MTDFSIEIFGEKQVSRRLMNVAHDVDDMRPGFDDVHDIFLRIQRQQFRGQGRFSGKWAPLAPSTIAAKASAGLDLRILHATERLRKSLTNKTSADHIYETTKTKMTLGSKVPHGKFHQSGTSRMPQRRPVQFTDAHKREMVKALQRRIMGARR